MYVFFYFSIFLILKNLENKLRIYEEKLEIGKIIWKV